MKTTIEKEKLYIDILKVMVHYASIALSVERQTTFWDEIYTFSKRNIFMSRCAFRHDRLEKLSKMVNHNISEVIEITEDEYDLIYNLKSKEVLWKEMFGY